MRLTSENRGAWAWHVGLSLSDRYKRAVLQLLTVESANVRRSAMLMAEPWLTTKMLNGDDQNAWRHLVGNEADNAPSFVVGPRDWDDAYRTLVARGKIAEQPDCTLVPGPHFERSSPGPTREMAMFVEPISRQFARNRKAS